MPCLEESITTSLPSPCDIRGNSVGPLAFLSSPHWEIFLLKIDVEGFDMDVLDGADETLSEGRVRFLIFEYNWKWFSGGRTRTLHSVVDGLYQRYDFACFFIRGRRLYPLFGAWWNDAYEVRDWSNIFCTRRADADRLRQGFSELFVTMECGSGNPCLWLCSTQ